MLKKTLAVVMALALGVTGLTACGSSSGGSSTTAAAGGTTAAAADNKADTDAAKTEGGDSLSGKEITFLIPFGDSSGTNAIWRPFGAALEEVSGCKVIYENQAGASGSVGTTYFMNQPHDGNTILCSSESTTLFHAQNLIDVDYDDLTPLVLVGVNCGILVTYPGSPLDGKDFNEVIQYIKDHPGEVTVGSTGLGGMPWVWWTLLSNVYDLDLVIVDYDGSGDGNTQLMGGHIDLFINGYTTGKPLIDAGSVVPIVTLDQEALPDIDAPAISEFTDEFDAYMPYGSYFVAEVAADTPEDTVNTLREAFLATYNSDTYQEFITANCGKLLGLTGEEANTYMKHQQAVISWMLYDTGNSSVSPSDYGVERPE